MKVVTYLKLLTQTEWNKLIWNYVDYLSSVPVESPRNTFKLFDYNECELSSKQLCLKGWLIQLCMYKITSERFSKSWLHNRRRWKVFCTSHIVPYCPFPLMHLQTSQTTSFCAKWLKECVLVQGSVLFLNGNNKSLYTGVRDPQSWNFCCKCLISSQIIASYWFLSGYR